MNIKLSFVVNTYSSFPSLPYDYNVLESNTAETIFCFCLFLVAVVCCLLLLCCVVFVVDVPERDDARRVGSRGTKCSQRNCHGIGCKHISFHIAASLHFLEHRQLGMSHQTHNTQNPQYTKPTVSQTLCCAGELRWRDRKRQWNRKARKFLKNLQNSADLDVSHINNSLTDEIHVANSVRERTAHTDAS
jgi:hypothetical protein